MAYYACGLMGTMVEAVLSTQCIQQMTCTRSTNWRDGVLSILRARWTASTSLRMQRTPGCPFEIGWRRHTVTSERVGGPEADHEPCFEGCRTYARLGTKQIANRSASEQGSKCFFGASSSVETVARATRGDRARPRTSHQPPRDGATRRAGTPPQAHEAPLVATRPLQVHEPRIRLRPRCHLKAKTGSVPLPRATHG
jgi:hypothetical protein